MATAAIMIIDRTLTELDAERVDDFGFFDPAHSPRPHRMTDLLSVPVAWILGRPWIGKSTAAIGLRNRLRTDSPPLLAADGRVTLTRLGDHEDRMTVLPPWWNAWVSGSTPTTAVWLIDGLDEVVDTAPSILDTIAEVVETAPVGHIRCLRLLLFSRPFAELGRLRDRLQRRYEGVTHRTRLPQFWLTRLDRAAAVDLVGQDRFGAVEEVIRRNHLQSVAGYPVVLNFLKTYRRETGGLTVAGVWRGVLTALLGEPQSNPTARPLTTPDERFVAASRIAAVLTLTRRDSIREWSPDRDEPAVGTFFRSPDNRYHTAAKEACRSALFSPHGDPVDYRFVQRNAQDWLTAFAFADLPLPALRSALTTPDGSLAARVREVARLLRVVRADAPALELIDRLDGGLLLPSDAVEPTLGESLHSLNRLEELAVASPWGLRFWFDHAEDLGRLRAEGLGANLSARLRDPNRPPRVKELIIDIARVTHAVDAVDAAVEIALDRTQEDELRYSAIWMVTQLGGPAHLTRLEQLIGESDDESEIECRIRGVLIEELLNRQIWPYWRAALPTPRVQPRLIDSRYLVLGWVERGMTVDDARHLLPRLRDLWQRHADEHLPHKLPDYLWRAVELVLAESPPLTSDVDCLIRFVREALDEPLGYSVAREVAVRLRELPSARHRLYLDDLGTTGKRVHAGNLLAPEDWRWLRDQALWNWKGNKEVWSRALWAASRAKEAGQVGDDEWEAFVCQVDENAMGLRAETEAARRQFEQELAEEADKHNEAVARDPRRRPLGERVSRLLDDTTLTAANLMRNLSYLCLVDHVQELNRQGGTWVDLQADLSGRVLEACRRGLEAGEPTPIPLSGSFKGAIFAEGSAFAHAVGDHGHDGWLTEEMVRRWLPTALFARSSDSWAGLISACHRVSPVTTEEALLAAIDLHSLGDRSPWPLQQIPDDCWTEGMTARLVQLVADETIPGARRWELLEQLAARSPERAEPIAAAWARQQVVADESDHLRRAGRNLLLVRNPAGALDLIEADFTARGATALEELTVLWDRVAGLPCRVEDWPLPVAERLATLLVTAYPTASDPDYGDGFVPPARELRDLRARIVTALLGRTGEDAAAVLSRLAALDPGVGERVAFHRANQRAAGLLAGFDPSVARDPAALSVGEAVRLLDQAGFRLVRSADDLLNVVMEALRAVDADALHDLAMLYSAPDGKGGRTHLHEDALQAYLRRRLKDELSRFADRVDVHIGREEQVAQRQRLDLRILAPLRGSEALGQVVVEIKWSTNPETRTGLVEQLGDRYLLGERLTHGVFLVGWSGAWRPGDGSGVNTDRDALLRFLTSQRDDYCATARPEAELRIKPFVLNILWNCH